ncbi:MAG: hypothetical protein M3O62_13485 [Pseudomonadota bacterium]|nr:hypothetical protein [Pseudomonadota bacterium]
MSSMRVPDNIEMASSLTAEFALTVGYFSGLLTPYRAFQSSFPRTGGATKSENPKQRLSGKSGVGLT